MDGWGRQGDLGVIAEEDVGAALFSDLLAHARAAGRPSVSLSVETDNPAVRLYERFGFVRVGYDGTSWTMQRILD